MAIAIFDSGIGGLSVLAKAIELMPQKNYIYYADTRNVPYGTKNKTEIKALVDRAVEEIMQLGEIEALVLACNTATSAAVQALREKYDIPILGMEPAVKPAVCAYDGRILVTATPFTLQQDKLKQLLKEWDEPHRVDLLPLPKLVTLAEEGLYDSLEAEEYLHQQLAGFPLEDYSALVLGCTHFNFFRPLLRKILPKQIHLLDGSQGTVNYLQKQVQTVANINKCGTRNYYFSGRESTEEETLYFEQLLQILKVRMEIE